jgi:hypothetical protein
MADDIGPAARHSAHESHPPPRPAELSRAALDFDRRPPTHWFDPSVAVTSALRHVLTGVFGSFLDKRELQANIPAQADVRHADDPELWVDYIADTGDGFDSTYTMASLVAQRELKLEGCDTTLRRGELLVLGGDEVYPAATTENYEQRLEGPFRAALPWTVGDHPTLYALPGNHDWYDGLTGFLRLFGQHRWIGGWTTRQTRSYFALQLPHRWWLWGMDIQSDQFVDEPQLRFFAEVLKLSEPGDRLVLATAEPSWIDTERRPGAYRNIAYVERSLLRPHGVRLELAVSGDLHHYNRYSHLPEAPGAPETPGAPGEKAVHEAVHGPSTMSVDSHDASSTPPPHLLTAGGGGAFLSPTHDLPRELHVPAQPDRDSPSHRYRRELTYPNVRTSRRLAWYALLLPVRNPGFLWVGAALQVMFLWTNQYGLRSLSRGPSLSYAASAQQSGWRDLALGLLRNPLGGVTLTLLTAVLVILARRPPWARRASVEWLMRTLLGVTHAAAHVTVLVLVALLGIRLASEVASGAWFVVVATVLVAVIGGVAAAVVVGAYFAVANTLPGLRVHGNEAFSAARLSSHRSFLRMHVDEEGRLTVYVVGVERIVRRWRPETDTIDPERSWLTPVGDPVRPHLVDRIVID